LAPPPHGRGAALSNMLEETPMLRFPLLAAFAMTAVFPPPATAAGNPISVHVLNLQDGLPSPGIQVTLERLDHGQWTALERGTTNAQGRISALYPDGKALEKGTYRVVFKTGAWFAEHKTATFFPEVPVIFEVDGSLPHYHIPLLLSPFGYSVYRGN
jgi:5-hydroxyisourate hydrolase